MCADHEKRGLAAAKKRVCSGRKWREADDDSGGLNERAQRPCHCARLAAFRLLYVAQIAGKQLLCNSRAALSSRPGALCTYRRLDKTRGGAPCSLEVLFCHLGPSGVL